ncbi:PAS domain S-box-containing protein/diguanylate cyclase (GGDEF) domain-containing protein [Marinospirillum celere]|uniref:PAS domain S-box-containing protein/diguanylate cyclase (GGDEF) domain-containing protein n=1 Tax=Marinospirillum celere TaxID=1122252 RepID=A0A1I1GM42_9GAMM|nr:EAL domain-containing protein [Marinospirillum celere]SFC12322.1 PAS domain S-box-containing protein/diguanylate cyclase (GGDEF) domain-containing protein [Marinospirillum celere]
MKLIDSAAQDLSAIKLGDDPQVGGLVNSGLLTCEPGLPLGEVARRMRRAAVSCILVIEEGELLGIWSEGDTRKLDFNRADLLETPIRELMSSPVVYVQHTTLLSQAASVMKSRGLRRLLVVDEQEQPLGMLTQSDIVRHQGVEHYLLMRNVGSSIHSLPLRLYASLSISEAVSRLKEEGKEAAIIERGRGKPPGIITERDLVALLAEELPATSLQDLVHNELFCVPRSLSLLKAVDLLREKGFRHLGVLECDESGEPLEQICGLLSFNDILASIEYEYVNQLRAAIEARDQALKASTEYLLLAQKVIETSLDGIVITNAEGKIQAVNPSFTTLTGYSAEEAVGKTPALLSSGLHDKDFYQAMWASLKEQGYWQGEIWNRRKNGEIFAEWLTITAIRNSEGRILQFAAIFSDITDRKRKEEQIHTLAYYDDLTGLANRRLLIDRLELALSSAKRHKHKMAVLFLDLDLFKRINDTLGHLAGDEVLKEVARRLEANINEGDSVARLGGDEFTVLVPEVETLHLLETEASRLIHALTQPLNIMQNQLVVSTSIGISVFPDDGDSAETLLKHADTAMYRAKDAGRNNFCFYNAVMGERNYTDLALEHGLRQAMDQESLYLAYQPKIDVDSGRWVGMEALLRWQDVDLGEVSPADFIPLAEKLGLIESLGDWVLDQVCQQLVKWQEVSSWLPQVSINVSARQLVDSSFAERLFKRLESYGLSAELIELELTESCLVLTEEDVQHQLLRDLKAGGIQVSIDDFGTGYSSLSYLRKLPITTLKIDASFIRELPENREDEQLVRAIIAMGQALGLQLVAEGVETPAQAELLQKLGCPVCQGFWMARPALPEQIGAWLARVDSQQLWPDFSQLVSK